METSVASSGVRELFIPRPEGPTGVNLEAKWVYQLAYICNKPPQCLVALKQQACIISYDSASQLGYSRLGSLPVTGWSLMASLVCPAVRLVGRGELPAGPCSTWSLILQEASLSFHIATSGIPGAAREDKLQHTSAF